MNAAEAEALSTRILVTWPKMIIPPTEWEDVFSTLDCGTAGTAYVRLRNTEKYPPTIADFMNMYRSLPTVHNQPINRGPVCPECNGDGFNGGYEEHHGMTYPVMRACRCSEGVNAARQIDEALAHNERELGRLKPGRNYKPETAA